MARSENPIPDGAGALGELAQRLRRYRERAGLSYRQLGLEIHISFTQLSRAASGKELPTWEVTEAYLRGCGITGYRSHEVLRRLWEHAVQGRRPIRPPRWMEVPLSQVRTRAEFGKTLRALAYRDHGWISVREIADITGQDKSSVADWISGRVMPRPDALDQFAALFGATDVEKADLLDARTRVLSERSPATTSGLELLEYLEETADEEMFLRALLAIVDHAVNMDHPEAPAVETASKLVRRRGSGTPGWKAEDDRLDEQIQRVRSAPTLPRPGLMPAAP